MKEQLILFETAKLATKKGFNEFDTNNNQVYCELKNSVFFHKPIQNKFDDSYNANYKYRAPTQSLLQKWLIEKHNLVVVPTVFATGFIENNKFSYHYHIFFDISDDNNYYCASSEWKTYEEAFEIGLQKALELI